MRAAGQEKKRVYPWPVTCGAASTGRGVSCSGCSDTPAAPLSGSPPTGASVRAARLDCGVVGRQDGGLQWVSRCGQSGDDDAALLGQPLLTRAEPLPHGLA